jgi:hypothetical protein
LTFQELYLPSVNENDIHPQLSLGASATRHDMNKTSPPILRLPIRPGTLPLAPAGAVIRVP